MKMIGGPYDGGTRTVTLSPDGPELVIPGAWIELGLGDPEKIRVKFQFEGDPEPSVPGAFERYICRDGAWHYVEPASPPE